MVFTGDADMSTTSLLVRVEDLINMAMGPPHKNIIDCKLLHTVLIILAKALRILETNVEVRLNEFYKRKKELGMDDKKGGKKSGKELGMDDKKDGKKSGKFSKRPVGLKIGKDGVKRKETEEEALAREQAEREAAEEREKSRKEKENSEAEKDKERQERKSSGAKDGPTRVGSIEVVTQSQFALLEQAVQDLQALAGPVPVPSLPDNKELREQLVSGRASLTDTMSAMQLQARVAAAEAAVTKMADLLTELALSGYLPDDIAAELGLVSDSIRSGDQLPKKRTAKTEMVSVGTDTILKGCDMPGVTHYELEEFMNDMRSNLLEKIDSLSSKAESTAENAAVMARSVVGKMNVVMTIDNRISTLHKLAQDYSEQLSGFDTGVTTQMQSFQEQMEAMRNELATGLKQMEAAGNNAESALMVEMTDRFEGLVNRLDSTLNDHHSLTAYQNQLSDELKNLIAFVEMLQEEKSARDELMDGLRDKANLSQLHGLVTAAEFAAACSALEERLHKCQHKFVKQNNTWMTAMQDLTQESRTKADLSQLLDMRADVQEELHQLNRGLIRLAEILGEPKAAILTRQLARNAVCAVCFAPALMAMTDKTYGSPPCLPALRPPPRDPNDGPCAAEPEPFSDDNRKHICRRWCGGSHTLLSGSIRRHQASPLELEQEKMRRYIGHGDDGRLYWLEEAIPPCLECNCVNPEQQTQGAGDQVKAQ